MPRIRTVKPELARHEALYQAERDTKLPMRFAWAMLPTICDREGRFEWKPNSIKFDVLPYDKCDFGRVLDAFATRGFILKYESGGRVYGCIPTFKTHQAINNREADSVIPAPGAEDLKRYELTNACATRAPRVTDTHGQDQGEGKGKGREKEGKGKRETHLPENFCISERVKTWAAEKGHSRLPERLEHFLSYAKRKAPTYADWDEALMTAIREDWAKLGAAAAPAAPPKHKCVKCGEPCGSGFQINGAIYCQSHYSAVMAERADAKFKALTNARAA